MVSFKRCIQCGDVVPQTRRSAAKTCSPECGEKWRLRHRRELYHQSKQVHGMHEYRERNKRRHENNAELDALAKKQAARIAEEDDKRAPYKALTLAEAEALSRGNACHAMNRENCLTGGAGAVSWAGTQMAAHGSE